MPERATQYGEPVEPRGVDDLPAALRGLPAFAPFPLPVDVVLPTRVHAELAAAEHALGRVDEAARRFPDRASLALCTRLRETQRSAHMSGESRSLLETFLTELSLRRTAGRGIGAAREVLEGHPVGRFVLASEHCQELSDAGAPLDVDLLGAGSGLLTGKGPRSGEEGLRTHQGWLGGPRPEQAYALTMPPGEGLREALRHLSDWLNRPHPLSRVGRIALAHLHLELLQPYPEANGHLARLFSSLALVRWGLLRDQVLPLAPWLAAHAQEYHLRIRAIVEGGAVEEWIDFFARRVREQAEEQLRLIAELERLQEAMLDRSRPSPMGRLVVSGLATAPVTTNRALRARYGFSSRTASDITGHLVGTGVLRVVEKRANKRVFVCAPVLDLYTVRTPLEPASDSSLFTPDRDQRS